MQQLQVISLNVCTRLRGFVSDCSLLHQQLIERYPRWEFVIDPNGWHEELVPFGFERILEFRQSAEALHDGAVWARKREDISSGASREKALSTARERFKREGSRVWY